MACLCTLEFAGWFAKMDSYQHTLEASQELEVGSLISTAGVLELCGIQSREASQLRSINKEFGVRYC
jgi:hypothetical protein